MKSSNAGKWILTLIPALLGLALFFSAGRALSLIGKLCGIACLVLGALGVYDGAIHKNWTQAGVCAALLVLGGWMTFHPRLLQRHLAVAMGAAVAVVSLIRLLRALGGQAPRASAAVSGAGLALGVIVALNPFRTLRLFAMVTGCALIACALGGLLSAGDGR